MVSCEKGKGTCQSATVKCYRNQSHNESRAEEKKETQILAVPLIYHKGRLSYERYQFSHPWQGRLFTSSRKMMPGYCLTGKSIRKAGLQLTQMIRAEIPNTPAADGLKSHKTSAISYCRSILFEKAVLILMRTLSFSFPFSVMLAIGFSYISFIKLSQALSIPSFSMTFVMKRILAVFVCLFV